ncbi:RNA polymerase II subunit B1 CTD phosphatase RTR1 [Yarrowia sp. C11]|nr:RNA polymerase II subunit B1 CTD phosphatase RTR1 [Yarrowia sp. E02]KAG5359476.1 RNA polymerase II subunit B1 CTD phosphatase RTR1 [Yarrowia sp. C11]
MLQLREEIEKLRTRFGNTGNEAPNLQLSALVTIAVIEALSAKKTDIQTFKYASRYLTPEVYDELVGERTYEHICGYPPCGLVPKSASGKNKILGTLAQNQKFDVPWAYLRTFCSKQHYQASQFYRAQLSPDPVDLRGGIWGEYGSCKQYENNIILLEELTSDAQQGKSMAEIVEGFTQMSLKDPELAQMNIPATGDEITRLGKEIQEISLRERDDDENDVEPDYEGLEDMSSKDKASAIEGYKPRIQWR